MNIDKMNNADVEMKFLNKTYHLDVTFKEKQMGFSNKTYIIHAQKCHENKPCDQSLHNEHNKYIVKFCEPNGNVFLGDIGDCDLESHRKNLRFQQSVMERLRGEGFSCSHLIESHRGEVSEEYTHTDISAGAQETAFVHMLSYVSGEGLIDCLPVPDRTLYHLGQMLACLRKSLKGLHIDDKLSPCDISTLTQGMANLEHADDRTLLEQAMQLYTEDVVPYTHLLETGVIHGDIHDGNIIVKDKALIANPDYLDIEEIKSQFGLIDFDDIHKSYCIDELAVFLANIMVTVQALVEKDRIKIEQLSSELESDACPHPNYTENNDNTTMKENCRESPHMKQSSVGVPSGGPHPYYLHVSGIVLAGYTSQHSICEAEWQVLVGSVCLRYIQEVILGNCAAAAADTGDNEEYLRWFELYGMQQLRDMVTRSTGGVCDVWKEVISSYAQKPHSVS